MNLKMIKRYIAEKDELMSELGFLVMESQICYLRELTRYHLLVCERKTFDSFYGKMSGYEVLSCKSYRKGTQHKVICRTQEFSKMYQNLKRFLERSGY